MRKQSIYRLLSAYCFLLILAAPLGIQGLHPWLEEHEATLHCATDLGQIHIHDQSFAFDHCFVCTFHFSHYIESSSVSFVAVPGWLAVDLLIDGNTVFLNDIPSAWSSRAPPVLV